jgi:hypothetical protein
MDGQLEIRFRRPWTLLMLSLIVRPRLSRDGTVERTGWGRQRWTLPAGRHELAAWFPTLFNSRTGFADAVVEIVAGEVSALEYRPDLFAGGGRLVPVRAKPELPPMRAQ